MNEKEKDTIIPKGIKMKYNMEMEYTGYKGQDCI